MDLYDIASDGLFFAFIRTYQEKAWVRAMMIPCVAIHDLPSLCKAIARIVQGHCVFSRLRAMDVQIRRVLRIGLRCKCDVVGRKDPPPCTQSKNSETSPEEFDSTHSRFAAEESDDRRC